MQRLLSVCVSLGLLAAALINPANASVKTPDFGTSENCHTMTEKWFGQQKEVSFDMLSNECRNYENAVSGYFQARQYAAKAGTTAKGEDTYSLTACVEAQSGDWLKALAHFEAEADMRITDAVTSTFTDKASVRNNNDGTVTAYVYEWTFIDYDDLSDDATATDVMGFGLTHKVTMQEKDGSIVILADEYNAKDVFGMNTVTDATYMELRVSGYTPTNSSGYLHWLDSNDADYEVEPPEDFNVYSAYDPEAAARYADEYVWSEAAGKSVYEEFYNSIYPSYNASGGDCTNYVSQCLYAGGMPMVKGTEYGRDGWFYVPGSRSATWTYAPYLRDWLADNRGKLVKANADNIYLGCPVFHGDYHATICVGRNSAGVPIVDSHNNDWYHAKWNYAGNGTHYTTVQLTKDDAAKLADIPQNIRVCTAGKTVTVIYDETENAKSYDVFLARAPWTWDDICYSQTSSSLSTTFENVDPGEYCAFVIARPNPDLGKQSEWVSFIIPPELPKAPTISASAEDATVGLDDVIDISWDPVDNAEYYICYVTLNGNETTAEQFETSECTVELPDMVPGDYICYVRAFNAADKASIKSNEITLKYHGSDHLVFVDLEETLSL